MATDINRLLEVQQTGAYIPTEEEIETEKQLEQQPQTPVTWSTPKPGPGFQTLRLNPLGEMLNESLGMEAAQMGWGQSRFDRGEFNPEADVEHKRAIEQSGFNKILNGAMKGGIYAATTAVETVAGVFDGLLEGGYELLRQASTGDNLSLPKAIGAGVDNFTARSMANIQKLSDEWFPNYRTLEERSPEYQDQWMRHIFTANFIGDSFLKNFGFTVGAIAGGAAWSKVLGAALRAGAASDLMKGVTAAAEGDATAKAVLQTTLANVNTGAASTVDATAAMKNLKTAAKSLNKMSAKQQLFGSVIGAMGEGTMEGVMARNEFMEGYGENLRQEYINNFQGLENKLIEQFKGTDVVRAIPVLDDAGNVVDIQYELNDAGKERLAYEQRLLAEDYAKKKAWADDQADRLASTTFLLNLPILTISNTLQFGRMFSGGWKTTRNNFAKVAGEVTKDGTNVAARYVPEANQALRIARNAAKVGTAEASEEMMQGMVSSGAKRVAETRFTSFNDDGYDRRTLADAGSWLSTMMEGSKEYLSDWKNWQEGFLGMITGLVGIPGRTWNGGIAEAVREGREETRSSRAAADILNKEVNSERFQNAWKGFVRHGKYESDMSEAIQNDDQYSWQTANDKQLINDVMMFADAGRLQDLYDIVDSYAGITDEEADAREVPEAAVSARSENDILNNPKETVSKVREQAQNIKDTIEMYNDIYDSMSALAPVNTTPDQLRELIATSMNIKAFEKRFLTLFDNVIKGLDKYVTPLSMTTADGEELMTDRERLQRAKDIYSSLAQIYTGTGIPVDTPLVDAIGTITTLNALEESIEKAGDTELLKQIEDMKKIAADRKAYLRKLTTLRNLSPEAYESQKEKPEDVVAEQTVEQAKAETEGLKTFEDYRQRYQEKKNVSEKADFINTITPLAATDVTVKRFLDFKNRFDGFKKYVNDTGISVPDEYAQLITPPMIESVVNDLFRRTNSERELQQLPDTAFMTEGDFIKSFSNILGSPTPATFNTLKQGVRNAMNDYLGTESMTESRKTINSNAKPVEQPKQTVSTPAGYDAAQPASNIAAPQIKYEPFGPVYTQFKGKAREAIEYLKSVKTGEAVGALSHPEIGAIDLVWGEESTGKSDGYGLAKLVKYHPEVVDNLQELLNEMTVTHRSPNRIHLESPTHQAVVRLTWDNRRKTWLLSAFEKKNSVLDNTTDTGETPSGKRNDTATPQDTVSDYKDINNSINAATDTQLVEDSYDASQDVMPESVEMERVSDGSKPKTPYYRTSVPEIATRQARIARDAIKRGDRKALMTADLSDFSDERYAEIWNALKDRNAFDNVATKLSVGDQVEFVVDPTFPLYDNKPQILIRNKKTGDVLTVLSGQTSQYYGLTSLRDKILDEYKSFQDKQPNDVYVFGKISRVWAKRPGLIDYDYSGNENAIVNIPAYDESSPIVFIDRSGDAVVVHGTDKTAVDKVSPSFNDAERNKNENKRGNLYYLSKDGAGKYIPIRLGVEHFKDSTKELETPTFNKIRSTLNKIVELTKGSTSDNLEMQNALLHSAVKDLSQLLDLHDIFFEIGDFQNVGIALKIVQAPNTEKEESTLRRADQITQEWLRDFMASLDRSIQIRRAEDGSIQNLQSYVEEGLITSNARMLRPKGVDFYINPWVASNNAFGPITDAERAVEQERREPETIEPKLNEPDYSSDEGFGNRDDFGDFDEEAPEVRSDVNQDMVQAIDNGPTEQRPNLAPFQELSKQTQKALLTKGYSEEEYNKLGDLEKEKILKCLSI